MFKKIPWYSSKSYFLIILHNWSVLTFNLVFLAIFQKFNFFNYYHIILNMVKTTKFLKSTIFSYYNKQHSKKIEMYSDVCFLFFTKKMRKAWISFFCFNNNPSSNCSISQWTSFLILRQMDIIPFKNLNFKQRI